MTTEALERALAAFDAPPRALGRAFALPWAVPGALGKALAVPRTVSPIPGVMIATLGSPRRLRGKMFMVSGAVPGTLTQMLGVPGALVEASVGSGVVSRALVETTLGVFARGRGEAFVVFGAGVSGVRGRAFGVLSQVGAGVTGLRGEASSGLGALGVTQAVGAGDPGGGAVGWRGGASGVRRLACVGGPLRRCG
ncbi:hypothetical protein [Nonomuraea angiospora]